MKSKLALLVAITASLGIVGTSTAADGTINFTGTITDNACTVDTGSANQTVNLGTVSTKTFTGAGVTASPTRFTINLTSCPATVTSASVRFDGATSSANNQILALNSGQTATNVGVALYEQDSSTLIPIASKSVDRPITATGPNVLTFIAKYYATATPVAAGSANSTANFTIAYN
ncbi:fimbrial protein [Pantoea sp. GM01]|uniref:fimbrial protein n=1 Tax=Pantoea sp. GM01 TaxID=1144320 RepID=UPI0002711DD8|nr:fimbrial protein [Pantoea sp. GM01]EJL89943.1 P pilus assembly protein, pilin FimA [Pantoea sp. GM01]